MTAWFIAAGAVVLFVCCVGAGCGVRLNPADYAQIAADEVKIAQCQEVGRACKRADAGGAAGCYASYDACMADAGMR